MFRLKSLSLPILKKRTTGITPFFSKRLISDSVDNGSKGQPTWPLFQSLINSFSRESIKLFGWSMALLVALLIWPVGIIDLSNKIDHVPKDKGAQVQLHRIEGTIDKYEADVEIPQTFVSLDKLDEEEGEDVTVDDEE